MSSSTSIKCPRCGKTFYSERGLSQHYIQSCMLLNSSNSKNISMNSTLSSSNPLTSTKIKEPQKKRQKFNNDPYFNTSINFDNHCLKLSLTSDKDSSSDVHNSTKQLILEQQHRHNIKSSNAIKDNHSSAEIDLLKILSDLNCHNSSYERIMHWAKFWNSNDVFFNNSSYYKFYKRDVVLRNLSKQYDMEHMQPSHIVINLSQDKSIQQNITVTTFDFQQQVLSLLRDKDLMSPTNLVLDTEPGTIPQFENDTISEINHSDWYHCAYNHFLEQYGPNPNRVICGIILAIDKTHTDTRGKLCLESVNFSLSIFKTETRRNNPQAWRSLGFINDLSTRHGSGIEEISTVHDNNSYVSILF